MNETSDENEVKKMENMQQMIKSFIGDEEQFEKGIIDFVKNRFIPKYAPKSMNEKLEITNINNIYWRVELKNENMEITFYLNHRKGLMKIHSEIDLPRELYVVTNYLGNINEVFDSVMKLMFENKIKGIFIK
jgi:hypothetical protein